MSKGNVEILQCVRLPTVSMKSLWGRVNVEQTQRKSSRRKTYVNERCSKNDSFDHYTRPNRTTGEVMNALEREREREER